MTPERFTTLAASYGADLGRWPEMDQVAARALLKADPKAHTVLVREAGLDAALLAWRVPGPGAALAGRVTAAMSARADARRRWRLWLSNLAGAAALAGGVAAGIGAVSLSGIRSGRLDLAHLDSLYEASTLGLPADAPEQAP